MIGTVVEVMTTEMIHLMSFLNSLVVVAVVDVDGNENRLEVLISSFPYVCP